MTLTGKTLVSASEVTEPQRTQYLAFEDLFVYGWAVHPYPLTYQYRWVWWDNVDDIEDQGCQSFKTFASAEQAIDNFVKWHGRRSWTDPNE